MKKILTIIISFTFFPYLAAQEISLPMLTFHKGCVALRDAIEKKDFASLTEAKMLLSEVRLAEFSDDDYIMDSSEKESTLDRPTVYFMPEFAASLSEDMVADEKGMEKAAHLMRGDEYDLKLLHGTIKPSSVITFTTEGIDFCEMALFSMTDSKLRFEIILPDGTSVERGSVGDESFQYFNWMLPDEPVSYKFVVTNESTLPQTFVIAQN